MDVLDFAPLVYKYSRGKSEDVKQVAWYAVCEAFKSFNPAEGVKFPGYVESRVKYAVWNAVKKEQRHANHVTSDCCLELQSDTVDVSETVERVLLKERLIKAMYVLPIKQRHAIVKTIVLGCSLTEYAREIRVSPQAVFNLRKKGLLSLKKMLV